MSSWNLIILIIVVAVGLMVLMKLFFNRKGRRDESTSNRLMQLRVFVQAVVVGGILLVLWLMGGGRPN